MIKHLGGIAEETLTAIKVVTSFGREDRELKKFTRWSKRTQRVAKKSICTHSITVGMMKFSIFFFYSYSMYAGSYFIVSQKENTATNELYSMKDVLSVLIALITGFVGLVAALPNIQSLVAAKTLGKLIFDVIERVPEVRNEDECQKEFTLKEFIKFTNVTFKYPTAMPEHKPVLEKATFEIKAGETTAIVGPSGSGKSTIIQLIERFYDPRVGGFIDFDGINIKDIDLKTLRENIGYVSQEPVMIMGTIKDNLLFGNKDATDEQCE